MKAGPALFDQVVEASGLNELVAPFTVSRLLIRADVNPKALEPADLALALPELERGLAVYLDDDEREAAVARLRALASSAGEADVLR